MPQYNLFFGYKSKLNYEIGNKTIVQYNYLYEGIISNKFLLHQRIKYLGLCRNKPIKFDYKIENSMVQFPFIHFLLFSNLYSYPYSSGHFQT